MAAARHHLGSMRQSGNDTVPVFAGSFLATRKVNDDVATTLHAKRTRKHGERCDGQRMSAHRLGDAGDVALADILRGLGRHVAQRQAAATTRENDIGVNRIACFDDGRCDVGTLVLDDNAARTLPTVVGNELLEGSPCRVLLD